MRSYKEKGNGESKVEFMPRSLKEWAIWMIWLFLEIIFLQGTLGSSAENEPRAAIMFGSFFVLLLIGGIVIWLIRKNRLI